MLINRNNISYDVYTDGFGVSFPEPFSIKVASGNFCIFDSSGEHFTNYPEFEFDVVADSELDVMYDVQLLEDGTVQVDRTELAQDTVAFYTGEVPLRHTLISFIIPPNTTSLDNVDVYFNNIEVVLP